MAVGARILLAGGALAGASCAGGATSVTPEQSVVVLASTGCRPTTNAALGAVVAEELVATVAHAVAGEDEIIVRQDGAELRGVVVAIDTALDAALLRVEGLDAEPIERRDYVVGDDASLLVDEEGEIVSMAIDVERRVTIRTSDIYRDGEHARPALDLVADVRGGDSGAPLVGDDGRLLALVWATSRQTDDRAWALPIEAFDPLLEAAESGAPPPEVECSR